MDREDRIFYIAWMTLGVTAAAPLQSFAADDAATLGSALPIWTVLPFAGLLLSIALIPLVFPHFWHHHFPKVSAFWAILFAVPFVYFFRQTAIREIVHIVLTDYIPFLILLWSLFSVSGGIYIKGSFRGTPFVNTVILFIGTLLASVIGTTGASMLLIRPILRSNSWRIHKAHTVVFFIFLVSNIGGVLTPLGDPPLFLGFLNGVPFFWTLHLLPQMIFAVAILLGLYFALDTYLFKKENLLNAPDAEYEPLKIEGSHNLIFLTGIIAAVLFSGYIKLGTVNILGESPAIENIVRDVAMIFMGVASVLLTRKEVHSNNEFSWTPIMEVAYLFAGIFITIIPMLAILRAGEQGALGGLVKSVDTPAQFFWATGILSSFLDNAPTYLIFFKSALAKFYPGVPHDAAVASLIIEKISFLSAISAGAVFMGAITYIGNAPNFMVKSIAQEAGVNMPGFIGYMFKYSIPILIVVFLVMTLVFY